VAPKTDIIDVVSALPRLLLWDFNEHDRDGGTTLGFTRSKNKGGWKNRNQSEMMMHSVGKTVEIRQGDDETNAPSPARAPEDKKKKSKDFKRLHSSHSQQDDASTRDDIFSRQK
jgi:hypothetical protein